MIHHCRPERADLRVWDGTRDPELSTWLGPTTHHWTSIGQLVVHTFDGDISPLPGYYILRYDDGELTVASPRVISRRWRPQVPCSAVHMSAVHHPPHEWTPQPSMPAVYCPGTEDQQL